MDQGTSPRISVVLVVGDRRHRSEKALVSVLAQDGIEQAEIVLIDAGDAAFTDLAGSDHPRVCATRASLDLGFGGLKALGARQARTPIVAYLEDHVEARPGWLNGLLRAFEGPWAAVGAEVHNANPNVGIGDAVGSINYGLWAPPMPAGEARMLAGNNTAYRRHSLMAFGQDLDELLISDTVLQEVLARQGKRLFQTPEVSIRHRNPTTLINGMRAEFLYHWCYGAVRSKQLGWSLGRQLRYILLAPYIVWLRWFRMVRTIWTKSGNRKGGFLKTVVVALFLLHAAVLGQTLGIAFGLRNAEIAFTRFELNGPRPTREESGG